MRLKFYVFLATVTCLMFSALLHAEARRYCGCCYPVVKPQPTPRPYVELGLGQAFDSRLDASSYSFANPRREEGTITLALMPNGRILASDILIGGGWVWSQLYPADTHYLPFISLGLQYQYSNVDHQKTFIDLDFKLKNTQNNGTSLLSFNTPYEFSQRRLLANAKLDLYRWRYVMPYVNLGLGATWNKVKQTEPFLITEKSDTVPITTLGSRNNRWSYSVGAGLDFLVNENLWLSLGYQYNNFGRITISEPFFNVDNLQAKQVNANAKPFHLGDLSTQSIQLTGRYLFA